MLEHVANSGLSLEIIQGEARGRSEFGNINNFYSKLLNKNYAVISLYASVELLGVATSF